jgi:hypothetical protein
MSGAFLNVIECPGGLGDAAMTGRSTLRTSDQRRAARGGQDVDPVLLPDPTLPDRATAYVCMRSLSSRSKSRFTARRP